jgi:Trypsin-like peptidase domain
MSFQSVEQGINAIQSGNRDEGKRLLKIALKDPQLSGTLRAVACLWLAQISDDAGQQRAFYNDALAADPNNPEIRARVESFLAVQYMPPAPPVTRTSTITSTMPVADTSQAAQPQPITMPGMSPSAPASPFAPISPTALPKTGPLGKIAQPPPSAAMYQLAGIVNGPNGPGSAFFVAREGLLATSRYVVGGLDRLTLELKTGRQIPGFVVRSYPEYDLALLYIEQNVTDLMPVSPLTQIIEDMPLMALSYPGNVTRGRRRASTRVIAPQWIPTDITDLADAGGGPVLDEHHYVIGMITRNTSSTSAHVFALHINAISRLVESFRQETFQGGGVYCPHCGHYSRAVTAGGYYCEVCGATTPQAENIVRFPQPQTQGYYYEHSRLPCPHCNATVGFHKNVCLRCGQAVS